MTVFRCNTLFKSAIVLAAFTGTQVLESQAHALVDSEFKADISFLKKHVETIVLGQKEGAQIALVPGWQGRVMTSTIGGERGDSFGWLNRELIARGIRSAGKRQGLEEHMHAFGGEDRFWLGPEGGQFSWYFKPETEFVFANWQVPAFIDTLAWAVTKQSAEQVTFEFSTRLKNWSHYLFDLHVERTVTLLSHRDVEQALGIQFNDQVSFVGYQSVNKLTNTGKTPWTTKTGMPSIWILGMFKPNDVTNVVIPLKNASAKSPVKDDYFGQVPDYRLKIDTSTDTAYFKADGKSRTKIGISAEQAKGIAGSWNAANKTLTLVTYSQPNVNQNQYVNSTWQLQSEPFVGDVINSYNDGLVNGQMLGPFYEIETSSPALALAPSQHYSHSHTTVHLQGSRQALNTIAQQLLAVELKQIEQAFTANNN